MNKILIDAKELSKLTGLKLRYIQENSKRFHGAIKIGHLVRYNLNEIRYRIENSLNLLKD